MSGSPYPPHPTLHHGHFSPPVHPISSYRTQPRHASLRSPYPSDLSAASAESPLSSSSANESPLPEPPLEIMDNDRVATANDDYYAYATSDDPALDYAYSLPAYALDSPEFYKQPVAAPLPLNLSLAMGYAWSPEAKKFQPLYPPIQHIQPLEHSPTKYPAPIPPPPPFEHEVDDPDLMYPSRHYNSAPTQLSQPLYSLRQGISIKQENDIPFPDMYPRSADGPSSDFAFRAVLDSVPTEPSSSLDLALQYPSQNQPSINLPVLSAPIPRHSPYFATSLVNNCERTCQEQEQQERHALRVRTRGLQEQPTVRPAEVSPIMGFAQLPDVGDEDAEGEPDVEPLTLHGSSTPSGHSTAAMYDYTAQFVGGSLSETSSGEDAERAEEHEHDLDYDYRPDEDDEDCDGDFEPPTRATSKNTRSLRPRSIAGRNPVRYHPYGADISPSAVKNSPRSPLISASDMTPASTSGQPAKMRRNARTLPIPIPVPNLTKKSRGRRVPTVSGTNVGRAQRDAALGARIYLCDVSGCGKCFARGEHLKRHIRSIHTYEKPHKCPYPGCGKEFSRHDNLGQHMKVHKDFPKTMERFRGSEA